MRIEADLDLRDKVVCVLLWRAAVALVYVLRDHASIYGLDVSSSRHQVNESRCALPQT